MRNVYHIQLKDINLFKQQLIIWANQFNPFVFLDSCEYNNYPSLGKTYYEYDFIAAVKSVNTLNANLNNNFKNLETFIQNNNDWIFGYLTYDLKNELENLESNNSDYLQFPTIHFFVPELAFISRNNQLAVHYHDNDYTDKEIQALIREIESIELTPKDQHNQPIKISSRFTKTEYLKTVHQLKKHIQRGDIYEINLCQEFYSQADIDPVQTFLKLKETSPTPFSCYYKLGHNYLLSASPERFLKKKAHKVISQPIKGTIKRGRNETEDQQLKEKLFNDPKERAENVMIVDLVRNDLSRTAKKGSVKVEELYGIYSFSQVHQMISTVFSEVGPDVSIIEIIKNAFPMGSMTGAPKVRAMELIEQYEKTKRGLYSGAVGFITPEKDFDFNVVIRSILYNKLKNYVSFTVGGAITSLAEAENEYDECMVKAQAMLNVLNH